MCRDAPPPPDFGPLADAMREVGSQMAALGRDQLAFGRQRYEETMPLYQQMVASNLSGQQIAQELAKDAAKERLKYRALEDSILNDVQRMDARRTQDQFAGQAAADIQQSLGTQRAVANRNLTRLGINPNSGRFAALNSDFALRGAAATAGAKTQARLAGENAVLGAKYQAANIGRGLPGTVLSGVGTAANIGGQAGSLLQQQNAPMYQGFSGAMSGLSGQMAGINNVGNLMNQAYQNQLAAYNADSGALAGLGQIAGMAAGYFSSEDYKKDKAPVKRGAALQAINQMPVESWRYKEGVQDGGARRHIGPYAEDFQRATGVGNGRMIPAQDAIGLTMKAVQELDDKVESMRPMKKSRGGAIGGDKDGRDGGKVTGPGGPTDDRVAAITDSGRPVLLSDGEYVIRADRVRELGKKFFDDLNAGKKYSDGRRRKALRKA